MEAKLKKILLGGFPLHLFWKILAGSQLVDTASNFTKNMEKSTITIPIYICEEVKNQNHIILGGWLNLDAKVESKIHKIVRIPKS